MIYYNNGQKVYHDHAGVEILHARSPWAASLVQAHHICLDNMNLDPVEPYSGWHRDSNASDLLHIHELITGKPFTHPSQWKTSPTPLDVRMMLSCLVDADHTDASRTDPSSFPYQPMWERRLESLIKHVHNLGKSTGTDWQNERQYLRDLNFACCLAADTELGIRNLDSPVGTGKTYSGLAHSLKVAIANNKRRIIAVAPLTAHIDQQVQEYRDAISLPGEDPELSIAAVHHAVELDYHLRKYSQRFLPPVIVTTSVNFFETIAGRSTSILRKLHKYANSIFIIEEAHISLHLAQWRIAWHWLQQMVSDYGCHVVLSSGTQIPFWKINDRVARPNGRGFVAMTGTVRPLLDETEMKKLREIEKTRVDVIPSNGVIYNFTTLESLVLSAPGPTAVVLNTINLAAWFAAHMEGSGVRVIHMSTALKPVDRKASEIEIRRLLETDEDFVVVGTSCIETGLNLSFRRGFRQRSGLPNIEQLSGRVNRNFEYGTHCIVQEIEVFEPGLRDNPLLALDIAATRRLISRNQFSLDHLESYLSEMHRQMIRNTQSLQSVFNLWAAEQGYLFRDVAAFHVIDANERTIVVNNELVEKLRNQEMVPVHKIVEQSVRIGLDRVERLHLQVAPLIDMEDDDRVTMLDNLLVMDETLYNTQYGYMASVVAGAFVP